MWEECFPVPGSLELFQHPRSCKTLPTQPLGDGVRLMQSSNISSTPRLASYHLQIPVGYTVAELGFQNPSPDECAQWNHTDSCKGLNGYWRRISLGCNFIMEGVFPVLEYYDAPSGINRMGWTVDGYDITAYLDYKLKFIGSSASFGEYVGSYAATSPWTIELSKDLEISLNVVVEVVFSQSFSGFEDYECDEAKALVEEATWKSLTGFVNPRGVQITADCANWNSERRRLQTSDTFDTEVLLPMGEILEFSPEVWKQLMEYHLDNVVVLTQVTSPICVGCDEILPMVVIDDQTFEQDIDRLSINMSVIATSTAAPNWKIHWTAFTRDDFIVTSEQAHILSFDFNMLQECQSADTTCSQSWEAHIDVDAVSGADGIYKLSIPMIQTVEPYNKSSAEYTLIIGDPPIDVVDIGEYQTQLIGISESYISSNLPDSEFYIGELLEYSFNTSISNEDFQDITILNMSITWSEEHFIVIPQNSHSPYFHQLVSDPSFKDGVVSWVLELSSYFLKGNGSFTLFVEGFIDTNDNRYGFHHEYTAFLHDLVCMDPFSTTPIKQGEFHSVQCDPDTGTTGVHFVFCSSMGWDLARSENFCAKVEMVLPDAPSDSNLTWLSILIIITCCAVLIILLLVFSFTYKRCRDVSTKRGPEKRAQMNVELSPDPDRVVRRGPFARNRSITGSADSSKFSRGSDRTKRIPRWRKETDKSDKKRKLNNNNPHNRLPMKSNEYRISESDSPVTQRKRQMFHLIAAIESKLAKSDVPLAPIEKVEIKFSRPKHFPEASRSRSLSASTKRCFKPRSASPTDSSPPTSPLHKPWRHPMTQHPNKGVTSHRPNHFQVQCSDGKDSSSNASSEIVSYSSKSQIAQMNSGKTLYTKESDKTQEFLDPDYHKVPKDYYKGFDMTLLIE